MIHIKYNKDDIRYIFLYGDTKELKDLESYLNKVPSYMWLPSFRGIPRPEVFLYKFKKNDQVIYYTYSGLWKNIVDWCEVNHVEHDDLDANFKYTDFTMSKEEWKAYVQSWGLKYEPHEYQYNAAWLILKYRQSLSQLATRAGKTLIAYMVFRYMLEHGAHNILMIVPNTTLVKQAVADMKEYKEFFSTETVWSGGELCQGSNLTVGTFQSLIKRCDKKSKKYDPKYFNKFDVICCDEAHTSKCQSIKDILAQDFIKHVKLRFGFSGSLPEEHTIDSFTTQSLLGPRIQNLTSKELIDEGYLAEPIITQIRIKYDWDDKLRADYVKCGEYLNGNSKVERYLTKSGKEKKRKVLLPKDQWEFTIKEAKELPYALTQVKPLYDTDEYIQYLVDLCKAKGSNLLMLEQMLVHRSQKRLDIMDELIRGFDKNCIVFGHHTEYLNFLEKHFKETFPDRNVYIIHGQTRIKKREAIIKALEQDNRAILLASFACVGTGLTLKNMDYCIFTQSFKSSIINKQALGRMLLKTNKDVCYLYDLIDSFPTKRLYVQGLAKARLYNREGYQFKIVER